MFVLNNNYGKENITLIGLSLYSGADILLVCMWLIRKVPHVVYLLSYSTVTEPAEFVMLCNTHVLHTLCMIIGIRIEI